jgi:hypothetical protein
VSDLFNGIRCLAYSNFSILWFLVVLNAHSAVNSFFVCDGAAVTVCSCNNKCRSRAHSLFSIRLPVSACFASVHARTRFLHDDLMSSKVGRRCCTTAQSGQVMSKSTSEASSPLMHFTLFQHFWSYAHTYSDTPPQGNQIQHSKSSPWINNFRTLELQFLLVGLQM